MKDILEAIVLGVVQGIAEFLPVSSSGHLVVLQQIFSQLGEPAGDESAKHITMNVVLHLGTLGSILFVYWPELKTLPRRPWLCLMIVLATIPAAIVGLGLKPLLEQAFESPLVVAVGWLITALMLWGGQKLERNDHSLEQISLRDALTVGLFQSVALVPGISRAGSTIAGGLVSGLRRESAAAFSFLIAIPAIGGAAVLESDLHKFAIQVLKGNRSISDIGEFYTQTVNPLPLCLGALTSFVVGILVLRWLIQIINRGKLHWFAWYCVAAATATFIWQGVEFAMRKSAA